MNSVQKAWWSAGCLMLALIAIVVSGCGQTAMVSHPALSVGIPREHGAETDARREFARIPTTDRFSMRVGGYLVGSERAAAPPGSLPSLDEEIWVIARPSTPPGEADMGNDTPGTGSMVGRDPAHEDVEIPMPLEHTEVDATIAGYIASVDVTQTFHNPYDGTIEALYVFPLPQNAAVNEFLLTIGDRTIRGIIREREEAERIYQAAKSQGYVAALLTQERANIFTQAVANIEPGATIDVTMRYFHTLTYDDGWYEFVFPTVVGPRFNPPGSADGVGAIARNNVEGSGQATDVAYLAPHERSGHDISIDVTIDADVEEVESRSHVITTTGVGSEQLTIGLARSDRIPNKDFVLRYRVGDEDIKASMLTARTDRGGYFTLMIHPPQELESLTRQPVELIFVLDCSGSMSGAPIEQAKAAIDRGLLHLNANDTFQVIRFSQDASQFGPRPVPATTDNIRNARRYVEQLQGSGGTIMLEGVRAALEFPHDDERLRFVVFLTDGFIGNEKEILRAVHEKLDAARIFSFGVGSAPNRYLMNRMAKMGRGVAAYLGSHDSATDVMDSFFERVSRPALTDVSIDWGDMNVTGVFPAMTPDLFVGRPVILTGRFEGGLEGGGEAIVRISGKVGPRNPRNSRTIEIPVTVSLGDATADARALPAVWARMQIADLMDRSAYEDVGDLPETIREISLNYELMSAYTAFVAVDSRSQTDGEDGTTVPVGVPVPEGVKYETTVGR